jgi:abortive infection bacteriophage resistance protein
MEYNKQALDTPDLLALLKQRGLVITNEQEALKTLSIISYFRLACYFRPMEADKQTHKFREGSTLEQVMALYEFDTALRDMVFCATRQIEVALRTRINHHFSRNHSPFWFSQVDLATDGHLFAEHLSSVDRELRRSKEEFIKEHFARYDKPTFPPAWKTLETVSFGTLSKLYGNFAEKADKKAVAEDFGLPQHEFLNSWMESLTSLRNFCAHHSRIWNRRYALKPQMPKTLAGGDWLTDFSFPPDKIYPQLCCIAYWLNAIEQKNTFVADFKALLTKYPTVDTAAMGFPRGWQQEPLWH